MKFACEWRLTFHIAKEKWNGGREHIYTQRLSWFKLIIGYDASKETVFLIYLMCICTNLIKLTIYVGVSLRYKIRTISIVLTPRYGLVNTNLCCVYVSVFVIKYVFRLWVGAYWKWKWILDMEIQRLGYNGVAEAPVLFKESFLINMCNFRHVSS